MWKQTDLRNNVILLFSLFYGVYFGFFVGLPLIMNISYILATGWLMFLGLASVLAAIKVSAVLYGELRNATQWIFNKVKNSLQPEWKVQSVR